MHVKEIQTRMATCERLRKELQAEPGTPAKCIILKHGMSGQQYSSKIRRLALHEKAIAKLV